MIISSTSYTLLYLALLLQCCSSILYLWCNVILKIFSLLQIKNVRTHEKENRMESFFLAETTKYLYLLFDPDNFLHNNGKEGVLIDTPNGECVVEAGGYIFNTEAHPIDPSALNCCHDVPREDMFADFNMDDYSGHVLSRKERKFDDLERFACEESILPTELKDANFTIDLQVALGENNPSQVSHDIVEHFEKIKDNKFAATSDSDYTVHDVLSVTVGGQINKDKLKEFMKKHKITKKEANETEGVFGAHMYPNEKETLENAYVYHIKHKFFLSIKKALSLDEKENNSSKATIHQLKLFLEVLDHFKENKSANELPKELVDVYEVMLYYQNELEESTYDYKMFYFILAFASDIQNNSFDITIGDVPSENTTEGKTEIAVELFDGLRTVAILRKLLLESIENLNTLKGTPKNEVKKEVQEKSDANLNDDIVLVDAKEGEVDENLTNSNEGLVLAPNKRSEERTPPQVTKPPKTSENNNSLLTNFVETIIKSTMPRKSTFDSQTFLQKIRANGIYNTIEQRYELLTCRAKPYAERFSYRTEIF